MEQQESFGRRLRQIMRERGLNYEAFGKVLDMRPQTLNRYVLDQREPKAQVVLEMAGKLGVDPLWLLGCDVAREGPGNREEGGRRVPIYGGIPGGARALEDQAPEGYAAADVADGGGYCYLRVAGEELSSAGIRPGDLVLLRLQESAKTGQLAACQVGLEPGSLQRYSQQGEFIILQPEHPASQPRILSVEEFITGSARILGVAVRLVCDL